MQILHAEGFSDQEMEERKLLVYSNTVRIVMDLCNMMKELGIGFKRPENKVCFWDSILFEKTNFSK
jgi:hypothetical protein